jgi:NADH:ubiquinone oxidoreductase subunit C
MDTTTALQSAEAILQPWAINVTRPRPEQIDVQIAPENLRAAVSALRTAKWGYLSAITGLDLPAKPEDASSENQLEAIYHICFGAAITNLRVKVTYSNPVIPTITDLAATAILYERELMELFGFDIDGIPVKDRLVLPDEWPVGVYPLRKSFKSLADSQQLAEKE